jgi:hypothetical protein
MENLVDNIRNAIAADASEDARAAGIAACRSLLSELEPPPTQALAPAQTLPAGIPPEAIPQIVSMVSKMDLNQLLDVAIDRLRTLNAARPGPALPDPPKALTFQIIQIPPTLKTAR